MAQTPDLLKVMQYILREMKDNIRSNRERMDIHQSRTEAFQEEIISMIDAHQERMEANMNAWRNKMKACGEAMEAYPKSMESRVETGQ